MNRQDAFLAHLRDFRRNLGIEYPFVLTNDTGFRKFHVTKLPTLLVADDKGTVVFVCVASGTSGWFASGVLRRLLASRTSR